MRCLDLERGASWFHLSGASLSTLGGRRTPPLPWGSQSGGLGRPRGSPTPRPETLSRVDTGLRPPPVSRPPALRMHLLLCRAGDSGVPEQPLRAPPIFASGSGRSRRAKPGLRCDGVTHPRWSLSPVKSARPCNSSGWGQCGPEPGGRLSWGWRQGCGGRGHSPCPAPPQVCADSAPQRTLTTARQSCVPSPSEPGSFP